MILGINITRNLPLLCMLLLAISTLAQPKKYNEPNTGNPIIPGFFADPTVKKFGDTYFIYATTDGTGWGTGPSQVWTSKDFVNWTITDMNWPTTEVYWAPDVWQEEDGKYYMYYSQPVQLHGGVAETPYGPWTELTEDGSPIVPDRFVKNVITLDGQSFLDDNGDRYIYWGTWGIYKDFGAGWGLFNDDIKSFSDKGIIPNTQATDFFEGPFMLKHNDKYYFTYSSGSCHDETYRVQYAMGDSPTGPFVFPDNNPLLSTNEDGSVHGPGHHSILEEDGKYYIIYHRHDNPHSSNGFHRQIAADRLEFLPDGKMKTVVPTHEGIGFLGENTNPFENLLFGAKVTASSEYSDDFKAQYAVDNNNGTFWMPAATDLKPWIQLDLGKVQRIERMRTAFQYATHFYQYLIEYSTDGSKWSVYSDKRSNVQSGSPMTDYGTAEARFVRLTITGIGKQGFPKAIWEMKAFGGYEADPEQWLISLTTEDLAKDDLLWANDRGMYGGAMKLDRTQIKDGLWSGKGEMKAPITTNSKMDNTVVAQTANGFAAVVITGKTIVFESKGDVEGLSAVAKKELENGLITFVKTGKLELNVSIKSVGVINRALHTSEIEFYGEKPFGQKPIAAKEPMGVVAAIDAESFDPGAKVTSIDNAGKASGSFEAKGGNPSVSFLAGKKALIFSEGQSLISTVPTPKTLSGDNPYTIETWVLNDQIKTAECIFDWAKPGSQILTGGKMLYGANENAGATMHSGWSDMGYDGGLPSAGQWHHIVATFDGYMERVYVDGVLNAEEQKMLFISEGGQMVIGNAADGQQPFTGAIASLKVYDIARTEAQIVKAYEEGAAPSNTLVYCAPLDLGYGNVGLWPNQAYTLGNLTLTNGSAKVEEVDGRLAMVTSAKSQLSLKAEKDLKLAAYTARLVLWLNGAWHEYLIIKDDEIKVLQDGEELQNVAALKAATNLMELSALNELKFDGAQKLAFLSISSGQDESPQLFDLASENVATLPFADAPKPLSSKVARMAATVPDAEGVLQYMFVRSGATGATSGWINTPEWIDFTLSSEQKYSYQCLVRDTKGRILAVSKPVKIKTNGKAYDESQYAFEQELDLKTEQIEGLKVNSAEGATEISTKDGVLTLRSASSAFDGGFKRGPYVYQEVAGDFIAQVKVADYMGLSDQKPVGYNDGALMVVDPTSMDEENWEAIQLSFFPLYDQGNMLTDQRNGWRPQQSNMTGWNAHRYLQIERKGEVFFVRTSTDGVTWQEMPGSPVVREDMKGKPLCIGLAHMTHTDNEAYIKFEEFSISVPK